MNKPTSIEETQRQIDVLNTIIADAVKERFELTIHKRKLKKIKQPDTVVIRDGEHVKVTITKG